MRESADDIPEGSEGPVPADSTAPDPGATAEASTKPESDTAAHTQAILDRAAAERAELERMRNSATAGLPAEDAEKKSSRWERVKGELLDPSWKTLITVLTTSGLSLAVGLVLVYTAR